MKEDPPRRPTRLVILCHKMKLPILLQMSMLGLGAVGGRKATLTNLRSGRNPSWGKAMCCPQLMLCHSAMEAWWCWFYDLCFWAICELTQGCSAPTKICSKRLQVLPRWALATIYVPQPLVRFYCIRCTGERQAAFFCPHAA